MGFVESKASLLTGIVIVAILGICYNLIANAIISLFVDWLVDLYFVYSFGVFVALPIFFQTCSCA